MPTALFAYAGAGGVQVQSKKNAAHPRQSMTLGTVCNDSLGLGPASKNDQIKDSETSQETEGAGPLTVWRCTDAEAHCGSHQRRLHFVQSLSYSLTDCHQPEFHQAISQIPSVCQIYILYNLKHLPSHICPMAMVNHLCERLTQC